MKDQPHLIRIELELDGSSPAGRVTLVGGETRTFSGWVGLMSVVNALAHEGGNDRWPEPGER